MNSEVKKYLIETGAFYINPVLNERDGDKVIGEYYEAHLLNQMEDIYDDLVVLFSLENLRYSLSVRDKDSVLKRFIIYFNEK